MSSPTPDPAAASIRWEVTASWALFVGVGLLMLGNGLQGSLLGLRATLEGFATTTTGVMMSGYYAGFLVGSTFTPKALATVGHIRVFAALASLASSAVLVHAVFVQPVTWTAMRLVTGFCMAGLFVVAESWLNDRATNETRGRLLSLYMVVMMGGMGSGQLLLNVAEPRGFQLFVVASVLVSLALVPISLTARPGPSLANLARVRVREVFRAAPLGVVGSFATGLAHGALFGMGAVYAQQTGLTVAQISVFMGTAILGTVVLQFPLGTWSDRHDRRLVIAAVALGAAAAAFGAGVVGGGSFALLVALMGLLGGLSLPLYSLAVAHTNDWIRPDQIVGASGALVLSSGTGAVLGPFGASIAMAAAGPAGFFWLLAAVHATIGVYALYRVTRRRMAVDDQSTYAPLPARASAVAALLTPHPDDEEEQGGRAG